MKNKTEKAKIVKRGDYRITPREIEFCKYYVSSGGKGRESAIKAGYPPGAAHTRAYKLLGTKKIVAEIEKLKENLQSNSEFASFEERMKILSERLRKPEESLRSITAAISEMNKCEGRHIQKHEIMGKDGEPLSLSVEVTIVNPK